MITRANLGWDATDAEKSDTKAGIIVHYDGRNQRLAEYTCRACRNYWEATREFHVKGNGWLDIGYAFGVCPHGEVYEGRGFGRVQAAARQTPGKLPSGNYKWVNVTFMSGPDENPTPIQIRAFQTLRNSLMRRGMGLQIACHKDFTATDCPGPILTRHVRSGTLIIVGDEYEVNPKEFWNHEISVPWGTEENPEWQADSLLVNTNQRIRDLEQKLDAILAALGLSGKDDK